jgi:hypothetical protein
MGRSAMYFSIDKCRGLCFANLLVAVDAQSVAKKIKYGAVK